jgi:hypothetical protein
MSTLTKSFRKLLQISSKKFGLFAASEQDADVVCIAENDNLPGVFNGAKAAARHFVQKSLSPDQAFNIRARAADNSPFGDGAGREQLDDPAVWRYDGGQHLHGGTFRRQLDALKLTRG